MSWHQALYKTYESSQAEIGQIYEGKRPLLPLYHTTAVFDVEITISESGELIDIQEISTKENTIIPCTVDSANARTRAPHPHGLNDNTQYIARDYSRYIPIVSENFNLYHRQLKEWQDSLYTHFMAEAVYKYISNNDVISDLSKAGIVSIENVEALSSELKGNKKHDKKVYDRIKKEICKMVRFSVTSDDEPISKTWQNRKLWQSWIGFQRFLQDENERKTCCIIGDQVIMAKFHAKKIRHTGDGAKIISSNDKKNYTYRGNMFENSLQACGIGEEVSQKIHNALIWLISKQGRNFGDKAMLSWSVDGLDIPGLTEDTLSMVEKSDGWADYFDKADCMNGYDTRLNFAKQFNSYISGCRNRIDDYSDIYTLILDSATPGRLAVVFYRHLKGSEFLERIRNWHSTCAWLHSYRKIEKRVIPFYGAPSLKDIVDAVYGSNASEKQKASAAERLIPCIIDGRRIPDDIFKSLFNRIKKRCVLENYEFNKLLTIACAIYSKQNEREGYTVALQRNRKSRDYLYGRLLSIADDLEKWALSSANEKRTTNAQRLMQRFADRPFSTYRNIEMALAPYKQRLGGRANKYYQEIESIMDLFDPEDFVNDSPLNGEFLIGYYCQHSYFIEEGKQNNGQREEE